MVKPFSAEQLQLNHKISDFLKKTIGQYHNYHVVGAEKIPTDETCIFVFNHSLATYDILLFGAYCYQNLNIHPRPVVDRLIPLIPGIGWLSRQAGGIPGRFDEVLSTLRHGHSVFIAPGGMKESIRSSTEKRQILWDNRKGFVRLSLLTGRPVVLVACPQADDLYDIKCSALTKMCYEKFRLPLPFATGRNKWLPFLPKQVSLTHFVEGPFYPPTTGLGTSSHSKEFAAETDIFHRFLIEKMQELLDGANTGELS